VQGSFELHGKEHKYILVVENIQIGTPSNMRYYQAPQLQVVAWRINVLKVAVSFSSFKQF
jgi:uncharacterized protein YqhQ